MIVARRIPTEVIQGENINIPFAIIDDVTQDPVDLSTATEIEVIFQSPVTDDDPTGSLVKKLSLDQVDVTNPGGGLFEVPLVPADTNLLYVGSDLPVELRLTIGGLKNFIQADLYLNIKASLFPGVS